MKSMFGTLVLSVVLAFVIIGSGAVLAKKDSTRRFSFVSNDALEGMDGSKIQKTTEETFQEDFSDFQIPTDENGEINHAEMRERLQERFPASTEENEKFHSYEPDTIQEEFPTDEDGNFDNAEMRRNMMEKFSNNEEITYDRSQMMEKFLRNEEQ